jgi:hypothetical protein
MQLLDRIKLYKTSHVIHNSLSDEEDTFDNMRDIINKLHGICGKDLMIKHLANVDLMIVELRPNHITMNIWQTSQLITECSCRDRVFEIFKQEMITKYNNVITCDIIQNDEYEDAWDIVIKLKNN